MTSDKYYSMYNKAASLSINIYLFEAGVEGYKIDNSKFSQSNNTTRDTKTRRH